ncbi:MAG: MBL fold metallo-hydrolase [Pseudomonadales bacterium]|nr:MBL fold metallo-hydrolase [Pseudomonadales bacterium]
MPIDTSPQVNSRFPQFLHHGAASGVTGSCHRYLASEDFHVLVDCGLFQGSDLLGDSLEQHKIHFDISCVRALIITHVHIDHIGRLPYLIAAGYQGPIYCSMPSAHLIPLVIEDALKIGFTRDKKLIDRFLQAVGKLLRPIQYKQWTDIMLSDSLQLQLRLQRAGHILGSAYVELEQKSRQSETAQWLRQRTVFSGDLGAPYAPLLPAPRSPYGADTLVIESTYGDRIHENRRQRRERLRQTLDHALENAGTVMIPAFSIGRTQELLYELESIIHDAARAAEGQPLSRLRELQIIVDSPLAARFTGVYKTLRHYWDREALQRVRLGRHPLDFDSLITIDSHEDHLRTVNYLASTRKPAVVLAASGMAAGGRIVNYLQAMLEDPVHCVLFVGYQAPGTPGHIIQKYGGRNHSGRNNESGRDHGGQDAAPTPWVELGGRRISIRARVESIGGYSAHADQQDLLNFVRRMHRWPSQIRIVHGNDEARQSLRQELLKIAMQKGHSLEIILPEQTERSG